MPGAEKLPGFLLSRGHAVVSTVILICLAAIDPSACTADTALFRIHGPDQMIQQCAMQSEAVLAALPDAILGKRYAKVQCQRLMARR